MNILFWSGGKDAFLALRFFRSSHPEESLKLLTTYNESEDVVPHQNINIKDIKEQAENLGLELITVPLPAVCPNKIYIKRVRKALKEIEEPIDYLIFGDWYLEDIREWREKVFGNMGYSCLFPIWQKDIDDLLPLLMLKPITVEISAVKEEFQHLIRVGEPFDQSFVSQISHLSEDIDPMGEKGEFHTKVIFKEWDKPQKQPLIPDII